jgi:hypothetical protein
LPVANSCLGRSSDKVRDFFQQKVLPALGVKEHLKRWLTISRTKYVLTKARLRPRPEIWCLTGLIELTDVTVATVSRKSHSVNLNISAAVVAALSGGTVPVGATIELGHEATVSYDGTYPGTNVWAAQYQLIDSLPTLRTEGDEVPPINYLEVYPDYTYSSGKVLGDGDGVDDAFVLEVEAVDDEALRVDDFDDEYWAAYREAEKITKTLNNLTEC